MDLPSRAAPSDGVRLTRIPSGDARFVVRHGDELLDLHPGRLTIGRDVTCEIHVDDRSVSRRHAVVDVGAGGVTIEDVGSLHGVRVNGVRIDQRTVVAAGSVIAIGGTKLVLLDRERQERPTVEEGKRVARIALSRVPRSAISGR